MNRICTRFASKLCLLWDEDPKAAFSSLITGWVKLVRDQEKEKEEASQEYLKSAGCILVNALMTYQLEESSFLSPTKICKFCTMKGIIFADSKAEKSANLC